MLDALNANQARFIALIARTARAERDALLGNVAEADLGGAVPARGERNPVADVEAGPSGRPESEALEEAVAALSPAARQELYVLMRIGQGQLAVDAWDRGLSEAEALGDDTTAAALIEDADLHDHLAKGLYEAKLG